MAQWWEKRVGMSKLFSPLKNTTIASVHILNQENNDVKHKQIELIKVNYLAGSTTCHQAKMLSHTYTLQDIPVWNG